MKWTTLIQTKYYNIDKTESIDLIIPRTVKDDQQVAGKQVDTLGIWCSGGADSSALLYLLCKEIKKNKLLHPRAIMVNDKQALSRKIWQLPETMAILILLDHRGMIQHYHEGQLTPEQEQLWLLKTEQLVNQAQQ